MLAESEKQKTMRGKIMLEICGDKMLNHYVQLCFHIDVKSVRVSSLVVVLSDELLSMKPGKTTKRTIHLQGLPSPSFKLL